MPWYHGSSHSTFYEFLAELILVSKRRSSKRAHRNHPLSSYFTTKKVTHPSPPFPHTSPPSSLLHIRRSYDMNLYTFLLNRLFTLQLLLCFVQVMFQPHDIPPITILFMKQSICSPVFLLHSLSSPELLL
jgi:hypothetical protein